MDRTRVHGNSVQFLVRQLGGKTTNFCCGLEYIIKHQQVILQRVLIWSAYQLTLVDGTYDRMGRQTCTNMKLFNQRLHAFHERLCAVRTMYHRRRLALMRFGVVLIKEVLRRPHNTKDTHIISLHE